MNIAYRGLYSDSQIKVGTVMLNRAFWYNVMTQSNDVVTVMLDFPPLWFFRAGSIGKYPNTLSLR